MSKPTAATSQTTVRTRRGGVISALQRQYGFHHLMGMSKAQMLERLSWLRCRRHFPGADDDIAFLNQELAREAFRDA